MPTDNPLLLSARAMARSIREGQTTSRALVEAHIAHVERVNPVINAVVETRFDRARAEADAADARRAQDGPDALPPLHGVPCTIKECFAFEGMPHTSGLPTRKGIRATSDAPAVARLRGAGAIPLGVTNTSELCMWYESSNPVYGRTRNPYDPTRLVGGSSGGEGAIVGAGGSPFGLGSDIGGSIRLPAFFNGVFGHKPTSGRVPGTGQFPEAHGDALRYLTTGPLARRAEDLHLLVSILQGPDGHDAACKEMPLGDPDAVDVSKLRVLHVPDNGRIDVQPAIRDAQQRAANHLGSLGCDVSRPDYPELRHAFEIWASSMKLAGGATFTDMLADGQPMNAWLEMARTLTGTGRHTAAALGLALTERIPQLTSETAMRFAERGRKLGATLAEALGSDGVMLLPTFPKTAMRHHVALLFPFHFQYCGLFNILGFPSTTVPLGLDARGLPVGCQVIAAPQQDHLCMAVAVALERAFGGWIPPRRFFG